MNQKRGKSLRMVLLVGGLAFAGVFGMSSRADAEIAIIEVPLGELGDLIIGHGTEDFGANGRVSQLGVLIYKSNDNTTGAAYQCLQNGTTYGDDQFDVSGVSVGVFGPQTFTPLPPELAVLIGCPVLP